MKVEDINRLNELYKRFNNVDRMLADKEKAEQEKEK